MLQRPRRPVCCGPAAPTSRPRRPFFSCPAAARLLRPPPPHFAAPPPHFAAPPPYFNGPCRPTSAAPAAYVCGPAARLLRPRRPTPAAPPALLQGPRRPTSRAPPPYFKGPAALLHPAPPPYVNGPPPPVCCGPRRSPLLQQRAPSRRPPRRPSTVVMATPSVLTFDAEGRAIDFEVWVDNLQLFLQCNRADGLSLFDLTSGASPAPAADADPTVRSQWATRDAAARLAVRGHLPTTERMQLFITRLPDSLRVVRDHFLSVCPTTLTVDLLEKALLAAEKSIVAVGASRGDPRTPIFEGCSPSPLLPSVASAVCGRPTCRAEGVGLAVGVVAEVVVVVGGSEAEAAGAAGSGGSGWWRVVAAVEAAVAGRRWSWSGWLPRSGAALVVVTARQQQQQQRSRDIPPPSAAPFEWYTQRQRGGGFGPCTYVLAPATARVSSVGVPTPTQRCFGRLTDAWRQQFPEASEIPRWGELSRAGVAIYDLYFDAILAAMYAVTISDEGDCYRCFSPDPGIGTAALGACEAVALVCQRVCALRYCPPVSCCPLGHLVWSVPPLVLTNLVSGADLQDAGVDQFTPASQQVTHCLDARTSRHLATFSRRPGSSLYTLTTASPPVSASGQVAASGPGACCCVQSLPPLPSRPGPSCVPCVEGRLRAAPHSSQFPPTEAPLQTLHLDVWGPARVRGQGHERYFLLVVDDYSRYTTVFPLRSKGDVTAVLIDWIRSARLQLKRSFGSDFPVLRLYSDRGREFSSGLLRPFCRARGIRQTFTLPDSPQQNGIAERRIGMVMDVARTSMMHAAAPHFLWPFAVRYAAHQINLQPRVSRPETSPALLWTGKVGDASAFRVWGSRAFWWQFYHPSSRRVLSSQDVTFDESVPFYRLFPYRTPSLPPPPHFLVPGPPQVDPLHPQGPAPSGVSQVDAVEPVEVAGDSGTAAGAEPGGADSGVLRAGVLRLGAAEPGGAEPAVAGPTLVASGDAESGGSPGALSRREPLSPQELRGWFTRRWSRTAGAGASSAAEGAGAAGPGAAEPAGPTGARAAEGVGAETTAVRPGGGPAPGAGGAAGGPAAGGAVGAGAASEGAGAVPAVSGVGARPRPARLPLPAPSPYTGPTGGLAERREPASRPASPVRAARASGRGSRQRHPPVPGTHRMSLRPSTAPLRAPLPSPPESSLLVLADPESDSLRAASPTVTRLLATVVTDPSFESTAASALVAELVDFATRCRTDVLEDRQEELQSLAAASPHLASVLLAPEGDPDALDIPTPRSYAEAVEGPYSSQWQAAMDAEMASWKSTGTYVDAVPPPGANIVSGMWIFRVKRPPGSPPVFKARYLARGFSQRQGVDYFQTFSPTPKMTTLRGSLHEEIWLRRPPGFTGTFPPGTQWSLRRPVYGLRQAPREWHDTLRTTLGALGFAPSTADPSLFLRTDTSLPPFYILVYVDDLVFATADTAGLAYVKSELQKRHTCTDLGEVRSYLGLQIIRDRARRTITLTQSHMVQQVLQRFGFTYSSPQATPLSTRHSLSALPSDESVESSGPYQELVGCLMYLMTCTRPDLPYPLSILARYVAPGRHRPEHMAAAKRVFALLVQYFGHGASAWRAESNVRLRSTPGAMAAQELRWLTYLLTDLGESPRSPPVLYVDKKAMLALCREQRLEHRTKHIALRYFLACELQQRGQLRLAYVASEANTADVFT
ncbi:unnamed protein product [Closterium sp. NIES-65]|nr:unnamed protein product [Closterium sp. NIES-65]